MIPCRSLVGLPLLDHSGTNLRHIFRPNMLEVRTSVDGVKRVHATQNSTFRQSNVLSRITERRTLPKSGRDLGAQVTEGTIG